MATGNSKSIMVCSSRTADLNCDRAKDILTIVDATCGKTNQPLRCRPCTGRGCDPIDCLKEVKAICQENLTPSSCTVRAGSNKLGRDCRGNNKYLHVNYSCIQDSFAESTSIAEATTTVSEITTSIQTSTRPDPTVVSISSTAEIRDTTYEAQSADATSPTVPVATHKGVGGGVSQPHDSSVVIGLAIGGGLILLVIFLALLLFKRRKTSNSESQKQGTVEEKPNILYESRDDFTQAKYATTDNTNMKFYVTNKTYTATKDLYSTEQKPNPTYEMDEDDVAAEDIKSPERKEIQSVYAFADGGNETDGPYTLAEDPRFADYAFASNVTGHVTGDVGQGSKNVSANEGASQRVMTENILYGTH